MMVSIFSEKNIFIKAYTTRVEEVYGKRFTDTTDQQKYVSISHVSKRIYR